MKDEILIASILRPWGVKGQFRANFFSIGQEDIKSLVGGLFKLKNEFKTIEVCIESLDIKSGFQIVKFSDISNPESAREFSNSKLFSKRENIISPKDGEYFYADLEGLCAMNQGNEIGVVVGILDLKYGSILEIEKKDKNIVRVPFCNEHVGKVDIEGRSIEILSGSLLEL